MEKVFRIIKRFKNWCKSPKGIILRIYASICFTIIVVVAFCYFLIFNWPMMDKKHHPEYPSQKNEAENSVRQVAYNYYLDYSPSMYGFIASDGRSLSRLGDVFAGIRSGTGNTHNFYYYTYEAIPDIQPDFFTRMGSPSEIKEYYLSRIENGELSENEISNLNLAGIFTDENFAHDSANLNVIITDLNFYRDKDSFEEHDRILHEFMEGLARAAGDSNISIYQMKDDYKAIGIDADFEFMAANENNDEASYLVIVFSENDNAYSEYIRKLEINLRSQKMSYLNKLELKNDFLQDRHYLTVDDDALYDTDKNSIFNFNYNNNFVRDRESYEIGLYLTEEEGGSAAFQGNVAELDIEAFRFNEEEVDNDSQIRTVIKTLYPYGMFNLREYNGVGPLHTVNASIAEYNQKPYLNLTIECDSSVQLPRRRFLNKDYFVVELQFFMDKPDYSKPQWVIDLDTEEEELDLKKKRQISKLVDSLLNEKEIRFSENSSDYEKYMGTLVLYISY